MKLEHRDCPVCGGHHDVAFVTDARFDATRFSPETFSSRKTPDRMHFRFVRCLSCDVVFADPAPEAEWLQHAYAEASFESFTEARSAARTYARYLRSTFDRIPERRRALDIGTGDGAFLGELLAAGFREVSGIEPSSQAIAHAPPHIRPLIRQGTFGPGSLEGSGYSIITCFQTLEHVSGPAELVATAAAALVSGGAFCAVTHSTRALAVRLLGDSSPVFDVEHLQLFSPGSIRRLLERAGLSNVSVRALVNSYPVAYWIRLLPVEPGVKSRLLGLLDRVKATRLSVPLPVGNLIAVGYKESARAER